MSSIPGFRQHTLRVPLPSGSGTSAPDALLADRERHLAFSRRIGDTLPGPLKMDFELLRQDILSGLHVKAAFRVDDDGRTPGGFVDEGCDPSWWPAANSVSSLALAVGIELCSYLCENDGRLFVHLTPSPGDDNSSRKSRSKLSGHTDASALPLPDERCDFDDVAPSPDLVVLACMRNPGGTETRIAPLSTIYRALDADSVAALKEAQFDFRPQASFSMDADFVHAGRPVLMQNQNDGWRIRFSHSNVDARTAEGEAAIVKLKAAIAGAFKGIALEPGDVLFVNNRTALHGRSEVSVDPDQAPRWLLRSYGMYARRPSYAADPARPHELLPRSGGPSRPHRAR